MRFHITKFKGNSFEGNVLDEHLPKKYQDELGIDPEREFTNEIKIEGEYFIQWDDDIPMPVIESLSLNNGNKYIDVNLDDLGNELFDLEEQISQAGLDSEWEEDRISSSIDRAYDDWKDRQSFGDD